MTLKTGIQRAVEKFDNSPTKLALAVGNGVLRQHVEHWLEVGRVSAEKTPEVSAVSGIPCEELNDKTKWSLVRRARAAERKGGQ
jgi:DNA-binding transcriptional regulator YdaS (Cro superfamily)